MSQIADIIKSLRTGTNPLSQTEIARRTGIPQPRLSRWESGDVAAGADDALKLVALAKEMNVYEDPSLASQGNAAIKTIAKASEAEDARGVPHHA